MMMSMDGSMLITGKILMPHMRSPVATKMTPPQAVKSLSHSRRHVRGEEGGGSIEQGEDGELGYGDEADREAEKRPEHDAAEQIENGLGEEDVRGPGDAFVYRAEDAHAAEAEGGNKGDDVHDVRLIAAVLAFCEAEQRLMHLARKDSAKTSSPMTEPTMRAMTTTGSAEALFTRVEPCTA